MNTILAALVGALLFAAQDAAPVSVTTKSGKTGTVQVLGLADGKVKLKVFALAGEITLTRDLSEFVPESEFMIEVRAADPKTFEQHFALAKRAAALDLLPQAGNQARLAKKAAGTGPDGEAKTKQLQAWAAGELERMIGAAVAAGDEETASHCLDLLTTRLPEERTEEQLAKLAESIDALRDRDAVKNAADRAAKLSADQKTALDKSLEPIRTKSARGDKELSKALAQSKSTAASVKSCESAVDAYKDAWKLAQELLKKNADDAAAQQEIVTLTDHVAESAIRAALHAANVLVAQSDYKSATEWTNKILKFAPDNEEAKEMQQTIQQASASSGDRDDYRWGWRRGRGRR